MEQENKLYDEALSLLKGIVKECKDTPEYIVMIQGMKKILESLNALKIRTITGEKIIQGTKPN